VERDAASFTRPVDTQVLLRGALPVSYVRYFGHQIIGFLYALYGISAFALITLGVMGSKLRVARAVIRPQILVHLHRCGLRLLPMVSFLALALGLVVIGQTVALMTRVGAREYLGTVMVTVVVRELGPLLTVLLVLTRTGMANVIELGTARALGDVETLEVLGIDPIHYLVVPRVIGMALGVFSLTVYLILIALGGGYLWIFIQDVPLLPGDYVRQIAQGLTWIDFILLAAKATFFGCIIALVTCYHGLAQPLRLEQVSRAATQAIAQSVVACVLLDALFIVVYLLS
jgi:phospholipid/cholesterol/gamma-HCH transport system permease protein